MSNNRKCAEYLKQNKSYHRCMQEMRKKWENHGHVAGNIILKTASEEEMRSIGGILGKRFDDAHIKFSFQEFEIGLRKTKFAPIDMKSVLEHYFNCKMISNKERRQERENRKEDFLEMLIEDFREIMGDTSEAVSWISDVKCLKKFGYQMLIQEYNKSPESAKVLMRNVGKALLILEKLCEGEEKLLAVFSAEVSGNPHYFDMGKPAAQLLTHAICYQNVCEYPQNAQEWRKCMADVGIISDNIGSMVHVYGLQIETKGGIHEAYEAFCKIKEPYVITGENLKNITKVSAAKQKVYVVENEMVFLYLLEQLKNQEISCLCTSGQLRVAAFQLLELLIESGTTIYYSGDLDAEGMRIADRLWQRYDASVHLWRMDEKDYMNSISNECLSEKQLASLSQLKNPQLQKTAKLVSKEKRAGYQENILEILVEDLRKANGE